jgi:hypothetical protein
MGLVAAKALLARIARGVSTAAVLTGLLEDAQRDLRAVAVKGAAERSSPGSADDHDVAGPRAHIDEVASVDPRMAAT